MNDLSDRERHEMQACGGVWAACEFCDEEHAARVKAATRALHLCAICEKDTGGPTYCLRCEYKREQLHNERLYDAVVGYE